MELIEREDFLQMLQSKFDAVKNGEGHSIFVSGEAGIGKTALVKSFCRAQADQYSIFQGACDALFTPRPLAPLFDILWQVDGNLWSNTHSMQDRTELFASFFREIKNRREALIIVFEDVHWADEATLDFIKFFARRVGQVSCLFILTYRDDEHLFQHSMRNILGQIPADCFTRVNLAPLSKEAVTAMALAKGYSGEDVYEISGGNPFYVNEILASYSPGVPENIKDSILAVYERQDEGTKHAWELCSVVPEGLEISRFAKIKASWDEVIDHCFALQIIIVKNDRVVFKHELYRRTIEASLLPFKRMALNKKILDLFLGVFEENGETERIVHYAKNANETDKVVRYAPIAARQAASVGAHVEASKLFLTAIEYSEGNDEDLMAKLYESYAYECYLTNQLKEAINYTEKLYRFLKQQPDLERTGNCLRFLSRLWWLEGNRPNAEKFAEQAIALLADHPSSHAKAMVYSNMSQLKRLFDQYDDCIRWGEKAIEIAREVNDLQALAHALNTVGSVKINISEAQQQGLACLKESLDISLKNSLHEHAARAYSNMGCNGVETRDYPLAAEALEAGIHYCEERDLDSWRLNMLGLQAQLKLETGDWNRALAIADNLLENSDKSSAYNIGALIVTGKIKMRRGDSDALLPLIEAQKMAFSTMELQRLIPSAVALLEYEWLTAQQVLVSNELEFVIANIHRSVYAVNNSEFKFWLWKARKQKVTVSDFYIGYDAGTVEHSRRAAEAWKQTGNSYAQALLLFEAGEEDKKEGLSILQQLGATAVVEKMKMEMRAIGIKNIPRGLRQSTRNNPAQLTNRELDVLELLQKGSQNKEIAAALFISTKTADHHISSILFKLDVNTRAKAINEALRLGILK